MTLRHWYTGVKSRHVTTPKPKMINMKKAKLEPTIKRSRAAEMLDKTPRTIARYEKQGLLTPIKLNCRSVVYRLADVQRLLTGQITIGEKMPGREANGAFVPAGGAA
jgi:hypothetical protein